MSLRWLKTILFSVLIAVPVSAQMKGSPIETKKLPLAGIKVLLVEDIKVVQMTVRQRLKRLGADNITIVDNVADAKAKVEEALKDKHPFDVVLMDNDVYETPEPREEAPVRGVGQKAAKELRAKGVFVLMHSTELIEGEEHSIHKGHVEDDEYIKKIRAGLKKEDIKVK